MNSRHKYNTCTFFYSYENLEFDSNQKYKIVIRTIYIL